MITAAVILALTYLGVAFTRLPRVNIDRPSAAFLGAVLMVLTGVLTAEQAVDAINFDTIALLLGMMLLVSGLQQAGMFTLLAHRSLAVAPDPKRLLVLVILITGVASAFLVNDAVVLLFTPVIIQVCRALGANPVPYLIAEAMASNIGSTATIVGNPQNALIGVTSGISFTRFFVHLAPVAVLSGVVLWLVVRWLYRRDLSPNGAAPGLPPAAPSDYNWPALWRLIPIALVTIVFFFLHTVVDVEVPLIALAGGGAVLLLGRLKPSQIVKGVDWVLLLFFAGLFVVIGGARESGLLDKVLEQVSLQSSVKGIVSLSAFSAVVSQLVSNVPLTMLLLPLVRTTSGDVMWLTLAAGSTLGGNATIVGAVANIIVAESAAREGVELKFLEFLKVGLIVTVLTVTLGALLLAAQLETGLLK